MPEPSAEPCAPPPTTPYSPFPGARQVLRLRRDVGGLDGIRTSKEIVYAVTSLPSGLASPEHLNHYIRQHWCVENRLHWIRDVTFHEDNSQLRTGTAPRALASFPTWGLNARRLSGRANIAHARRDLHDRNDAFAVYDICGTVTKPDTKEQRRGAGHRTGHPWAAAPPC